MKLKSHYNYGPMLEKIERRQTAKRAKRRKFWHDFWHTLANYAARQQYRIAYRGARLDDLSRVCWLYDVDHKFECAAIDSYAMAKYRGFMAEDDRAYWQSLRKSHDHYKVSLAYRYVTEFYRTYTRINEVIPLGLP